MERHYQVCAVDLGVDPDGPTARILYDECVNIAAARGLRDWRGKEPHFENQFLFVREVETTVRIRRVGEDERDIRKS